MTETTIKTHMAPAIGRKSDDRGAPVPVTGWVTLGNGEVRRLAHPMARVAARIIDLAVLCPLYFIVFVGVIYWVATPSGRIANALVISALLILPLLYETICIVRTGQTVGKSICQMRVVEGGDGSRPGWGPSLMRALFITAIPPVVLLDMRLLRRLSDISDEASNIPALNAAVFSITAAALCALPVFLGFTAQGWHDRAGRTVVVAARMRVKWYRFRDDLRSWRGELFRPRQMQDSHSEGSLSRQSRESKDDRRTKALSAGHADTRGRNDGKRESSPRTARLIATAVLVLGAIWAICRGRK
jgi:uncharacterized RDD family membrane protein YckC